jgi:phosphoglycerate dehydrogenase-like enzyme
VARLRWLRCAADGDELSGKTMAVVGFGDIGRVLGKRATAFEMDVVDKTEGY